ncbi:SRPBCC domain-containing protein [Pricia sp. S334]|uniref:SRPBCC domain-containing protein n=1 Tax=Pricia mediterranea TaxID=3076079 RepID=A0ABU3LAB1_9FLAO|nr:SRPBCC domain-containing protein [Pricia sp. S334]MDT7830680.1 SRPBCC domain-containing protein [Pricia sp. S334]
METKENTSERTLSITKTMPAPVQSVWEYWTKPEHIVKWWGPEGMKTNIVKHDFNIGGGWRFTVEKPDGNTFVSDGTYADIVPNKKLVTSADFKPMTIGVVLKLLFEEDGSKTHVKLHILHPTVAYCQQQKGEGFYKGWDAAFDRLERYLTSEG